MRLPGLTGEESTSLSGGARSGGTAGTLRGKCPAGVPSARGAPPKRLIRRCSVPPRPMPRNPPGPACPVLQNKHRLPAYRRVVVKQGILRMVKNHTEDLLMSNLQTCWPGMKLRTPSRSEAFRRPTAAQRRLLGRRWTHILPSGAYRSAPFGS